MPLLAEYLLHLVGDTDAAKQHNHSHDDAVKSMQDFGLTTAQQNILLTGDPAQIQSAANQELSQSSAKLAASIAVNPDFIGPPWKY